MAEPSFSKLRNGYRNLWDAARLTRPEQTERAARKILANRKRYEAVADRTGVPWYFIAVTHMRESSNNFAGVLHNGEHIIGTGRKTRLVPKGRGPFNSWESAAIDALKLKGLHRIPDWPIERVLYECERFNGWGYFWKKRTSPYVWAGTQHYKSGKYVADGVYDAGHVDTQLGVAAVLKKLALEGVDLNAGPIIQAPEESPPPPDIEPKPEVESPKAEDQPTKPAIKSKTIWAQIGVIATTILSYATDWRVLAVLAIAFAVFAILDRYGKIDIRGWFK